MVSCGLRVHPLARRSSIIFRPFVSMQFSACSFFFLFLHPSSLHPSRISTGLWLAVVSRREIIVCGGGWSFERGEGEGLAHLHGGLVRSRATFSIVSVGEGTRVSGILGFFRRNVVEWMRESGENLSEGCHPAFIYTFLYIYIFEYFRVSRETSKINCHPCPPKFHDLYYE